MRVAYLAADFHRHATAFLMAELFERHHRSRFEISGVSFGVDDKSEMARGRSLHRPVDDVCRKSDEEVAKLLHHLPVDIAIDLKGYTQDRGRASLRTVRRRSEQAYRLSGYDGDQVHRLHRRRQDGGAVEHQPFYMEKIVHLPDRYQVNHRSGTSPSGRQRGMNWASEMGFVFCCFNNLEDHGSDVFSIWTRLCMWSKAASCGYWATTRVRRGTAQGSTGTRGSNWSVPRRQPTAARRPLLRATARHLFLDRPPWNAPYDSKRRAADWPSVPTCEGTAFCGRVAASLLDAVGLPDLVTHSIEDYEALALRLGERPLRFSKDIAIDWPRTG